MMLFRRTFLALGAAFACATDRRSTPMPPDTLDLVALFEQTPRNEVIVRVEEQLERGLRPVDLLAALQLAATRTISTRADFGPPHHALLCGPAVARIEQSLHTRGPLLWAVDFFKSAQAEAQVPGERMPPADRLPSVPGSRAQAEFVAALNEFDGARAESAIVSLHRHAPLRQVVDTLLVHGSKDLRHIGHKALHAAHGCRVSNASAWADAEPVFRSIASTLALHYDEEGHDHDTPWTENQARIRRLPDAWPAGDHSDEAIEALLATLRSASPHDACEEVVAWSRRGVSARCVWDAMLLSGAELMFNNPLSIEALHAVTASNAARFAYEQLQQPPDRRLVFMQNVARVADFHGYVAHRSKPQWSVGSLRIDELEPTASTDDLDAIFADVGGDDDARLRAARATLALLETDPAAIAQLERRAAELVVAKVVECHDYKVCAAAFEDFAAIAPRWRARYLAACTSRFRGTNDPDAVLGA